ncbi:copper resistance protein NlpE N-terminal domain-containing protein [Eikenella sp. S3360]|uniref:Copper resistance protein NlpE N-terminal domain-containing protein n=1 Tax=Eikenella glucosivorans TaxID=2766967 RepID=A0ABS0ND53_9NEIS|nr:copper resistance protein NlpE [Eikenella glucosivorans]MBH5330253.1 copper resistance protein NlpE N-terminal domain-containing protein [Eikenella glucosivorans]
MKATATLPLILLLAACAPQENTVPAPAVSAASAPAAAVSQPEAAPASGASAAATEPGHTWAGRYHGVLPCASCEGIETTLVLNADGSYRLTETYQQRHPLTEEASGRFTWRSEGQVLRLDQAGSERLYQIGNGQIWALDMDGKQIEGELAPNYILKQTQ